jgi:CRP-like cAMP-binding protein
LKRTWRLSCTADGDAYDLRFGIGVHTLGSAPTSELRVSDPTVSRSHARLTCTEEGITVEDLGSTNGTAVDGETVDGPVVVTDRARLKVGRLVFDLGPLQTSDAADRLFGTESSSGASVLLGPATVGFLRDAGEEVGAGEGDVIVRRGEHQEYFYVVIEGEVELLLSEGEGRGRPLARIGEGGIFGAESVLGKEGAAIDAVAVTDVRLLRYPASALPSALQESASLRRKLLGGIARQIHKTTSDALDLMHGAEVMARLVQGDNDPDELIAASPRMKAIKKKVEKCAESDHPMLVLGEDGTGKTLIARLIHDDSARSKGPLIAVNCRELAPGHAAELILGEDLGGRLPVGERASGGIHLAHGGTIVLRGADALEPAAQHLISAHLRGQDQRKPGAYPDTRFIITARDASTGEETAGLTQDLAECFDEVIEIPPLGKRLKDILPLAEEFMQRQGPNPPVITEGARHALLSLRYQRRNIAELREILDLAVRVAEGDEIRAEHIFGGVGDDAIVPGMATEDEPASASGRDACGLRGGHRPVSGIRLHADWARRQHRHLVPVGADGLCPLLPCRAGVVHHLSSLHRRPLGEEAPPFEEATAGVADPSRTVAGDRRLRPHHLGRAGFQLGGEPRRFGAAAAGFDRLFGGIGAPLQTRGVVSPPLSAGSSGDHPRPGVALPDRRQIQGLRIDLHDPRLLSGNTGDPRLHRLPSPPRRQAGLSLQALPRLPPVVSPPLRQFAAAPTVVGAVAA